MKSVDVNFDIMLVSISNLPETNEQYRLEWKRSNEKGQTRNFSANKSPKELTDEKIELSIKVTQDKHNNFSKKEMAFSLKEKEGSKSKLLGSVDFNLSDYISKDEELCKRSSIDLVFENLDKKLSALDLKPTFKIIIQSTKKIHEKKKGGGESSVASTDDSLSERSGEDSALKKRENSKSAFGMNTGNNFEISMSMNKMNGIPSNKYPPKAQFYIKCTRDNSTIGQTTPTEMSGNELIFDDLIVYSGLFYWDKDQSKYSEKNINFTLYTRWNVDSLSGKEEKETIGKMKLNVSEYLNSSSKNLTLSFVPHKETIDGIIGRARSGSLGIKPKTPQPVQVEIQLDLTLKISKVDKLKKGISHLSFIFYHSFPIPFTFYYLHLSFLSMLALYILFLFN